MSSKITFAHLADLHLGAWREKRLTELNFETFCKAIDKVIEREVDFCLFAGDIFNSAMPPIEIVNKVVVQLMRFKEAGIPLYVIGGSHDYSNSGKSFLELLESAGVFIDVCKYRQIDSDKVELKFTRDKKTGSRISGILGKKKGLDKNIYTNLKELEMESDSFNIFMFHCTLDDFKPDFMRAVQVDINSKFLPKGFDYYAGGHVHTHIEGRYDKGVLSYPGPLFPNNFSELKREKPSFNICTFDTQRRNLEIERIFIKTYEKEYVDVKIKNDDPVKAREKVMKELENIDLKNKILLLEVSGIVEGKIADIKMNEVIASVYERKAFHVLKNTYKLSSAALEKADIDVHMDSKEIEERVFKEYLGNNEHELMMVKALLRLELAKQEEEKNSQYEQRIYEAVDKSLNITND